MPPKSMLPIRPPTRSPPSMPPQPGRCIGDCMAEGAAGLGVLGRLGDTWLGDRGAE